MKDCKCGRIPPCYSGKKFRIHEELEKMPRVAPLSEETAQEMIKTLEDFSKSLVVELKTCELINRICEDAGKSIKSDDMEEKKTKKMTKAEAFEYLKGKKVLCYSSKMEAVQGFVKSLGFHWFDYSEEPMLVSTLFLGEDGRLSYSVSLKWFEEHKYEEISADDILSIEIIKEKKDDERKGEILEEIAKLGGKISDLIEEYGGDVIVEIDLFDVILRNSGDILYRKR